MHDFVYRYSCKGCGEIHEVATLRRLTDAQKRQVRQRYCPSCELKGIVKLPKDKSLGFHRHE